MLAFFTSFLSGHWLADLGSWIWDFAFVGGTKWAWSLYVATWGHAGFLWWLIALVVLLLVIFLLIPAIWTLSFLFLVVPWAGFLLVWLFVWALVLISRFAILLWPAFIWFCKIFILPVFAGLFFKEMQFTKGRKYELSFYFLYPAYFILLFVLLPVSWAVWFSLSTAWFFWLFSTQTPYQEPIFS